MSVYREELLAAQRAGCAAHEAMEKWVSRPAEAPDDTPGAVLEGHARDLCGSRERLRHLYSDNGNRDDIMAALEENEALHRLLGLSIRDKPELDTEE